MQSPPLARIRNLGIISHIDAGKTTVSERILYYTGAVHRMGEVHDGATTMDWMDQEQERGITITATTTTCCWGETWINLIDTPGHIDFTIEVERSLRVLDGAVVIFSAVEGVQPQSESVWHQADRYHVPRICLINKLDRIGADPEAVLEQMRQRLAARPVALQLPVGRETDFHGVIDLLEESLLTFSEADQGVTVVKEALPEALRAAVVAARNRLVEAAADCDDSIMEDYLEGRDVPPARLRAALRAGTLQGVLCPVFFGAALRNKGIQPLLDGIRDFLPSPLDLPPVLARQVGSGAAVAVHGVASEPLCALAFKVVADEGRKLAWLRIYSGTLQAGDLLYNVTRNHKERCARLFRLHAHRRETIAVAGPGEIVAVTGLREVLTGDTLCAAERPLLLEGVTVPETVVSLAIEPRSSADRDKLLPALEKLQWEDPTLRVREEGETGQTLVTGMGELHIEIMLERLRREYGVEVKSGQPQVVCRETVRRTLEHREVFQRDLEGRTQAGEVLLRVMPLSRGSGLQLALPADAEGMPAPLVEVLRESLHQASAAGVLAGYPLTDLEVRIVEAPWQPGLTTEHGLRAAVQRGVAVLLQRAEPLLLEPVMTLELTVPSEYAGRVQALLLKRHGRVEGLLSQGAIEVIRAQAPLAALFGFMTELRSATRGLGSFSMEFARFDVASTRPAAAP